MNLSIQEQEIYQAVIRLSRSIAQAQTSLSPIQERNFQEVLQEVITALDDSPHFVEKTYPEEDRVLNRVYQDTLKVIAKNKKALNRVLIRRFTYLLERIFFSLGIPETERQIVDQFEQDTLQLYRKKNTEDDLKMSPELSSLYSTIGQLAYVIAMADHVMMPEEKAAFKKVIKENLGHFDWLAEDRFNVVEELMSNDLESTYEHAIYLIERNRSALNEHTIQKFLNVMTEVALVAGISQEERTVINRFKQDIHAIYYEE